MTARTLVLGMGNTLLQDDGAGVHAVRRLQEQAGDLSGTEFLDVGTLSFTLAAVIEDAEKLIIIDAAKMQQAPGTVQVFEGEEMDRFLNRQRRLSVHEVSLVDLLAIARLTGLLPARRALIGIEPQSLDWGDAPTAPVAQAIPHAGAAALELIERWRGHA
ncbi:MAG: HyaD/HybD family hydrogenase maturation endopeptidase [Pseudomonadota bacterium]